MEGKTSKISKLQQKVLEKMKDTKQLLLSTMDPVMLDTLKEIVKKDMEKEIEKMKYSDEGCTDICRLKNQILEIDNERCLPLVENAL